MDPHRPVLYAVPTQQDSPENEPTYESHFEISGPPQARNTLVPVDETVIASLLEFQARKASRGLHQSPSSRSHGTRRSR